jgi:hypothetical protein
MRVWRKVFLASIDCWQLSSFLNVSRPVRALDANAQNHCFYLWM